MVLALAQRLDNRINAIPDNAKQKSDVPADQSLDENVGRGKTGFAAHIGEKG
jgi:hypothetical protein